MKIINFVAPVPPQRTGIADYVDGLLRGLQGLGRPVAVYTQTRYAWQPVEGLEVKPLIAFPDRHHDPETTVYHIGNNAHFHDEQVLHFIKHGGIVHLHDFCLHHLFGFFTADMPDLYYALLERWYGKEVSNSDRERRIFDPVELWERPDVLNYPLNEEVLSRATGVIVHSELARNYIKARFPKLPVTVVPQAYPDAKPTKRKHSRPFRVCVMGFVSRNKKLETVISAIDICRSKGVSISLDIIGSVTKECEHLIEKVQDLGLTDQIYFRGHVSQDAFHKAYQSYHACIVLRDPTVGETSAIVSRSLQYGLPLIVSNIGTYKEIPDFFPKIENGPNASEHLSEVLVDWASNIHAYQAVADKAYGYALRGPYNYWSMCKAYNNLFEN
jgi:glycosyltransferase involved in cell wall biosynthesis